jgi:hypothetical protein
MVEKKKKQKKSSSSSKETIDGCPAERSEEEGKKGMKKTRDVPRLQPGQVFQVLKSEKREKGKSVKTCSEAALIPYQRTT